MVSLAGLSLAEIEGLLAPLPKFRAKQIYNWIIRGANSFEKMTDLSVSLRAELSERFKIFSGSIESVHGDKNAKKTVIELQDGLKIEAVLLNDGKDRRTACLSTQVGCPSGCVFCRTGLLGFKRNLESFEIVEQFFLLREEGFLSKDNLLSIDNIVIMGMGEPLLNLENLRKAILFFTDKAGLNFSRRRITVSTCGICDALFDLAKNGPFFRLALSLATADESLRRELMPITKTNPLEKIKEALRLFQQNGGGRITLEIPLLGGANTSEKDAKSIADFARGMETVINVIPWNPVANLDGNPVEFNGKPLQEPVKEEIKRFVSMLEKQELKVTTRLHKGRSVMGACGQLGVS